MPTEVQPLEVAAVEVAEGGDASNAPQSTLVPFRRAAIIGGYEHLPAYRRVHSLKIPSALVGPEELYVDGAAEFSVEVSLQAEISNSAGGAAYASTSALAYPSNKPECDQNAHSLKGHKEKTTHQYFVGDGSFPAGLSRADFVTKVKKSINNIRDVYNNCGRADSVNFGATYGGYTTYESDITNSGGYYECTDGSLDNRDGVSAWDAPNIDKNPATGKSPCGGSVCLVLSAAGNE